MTAGPKTTARDGTVAGAMKGDRGAMQALWQAHRRWIAAVLLVHKSPDDQLEDLLQEVAMTIVSKIDTLRSPGNVRAWLRTVAINVARASARARRARPHAAPLVADPPCDGRARRQPAVDDEARNLMVLAGKLPAPYREPLMLRALRGMRGRHIAEILEISEATVETRIARARRMLRDLASGEPDEPGRLLPVTQHGSNHEPAA